MSLRLGIELDGADRLAARLRATDNQIHKASVRAINKTAVSGRAAAVKQIRERATIKSGIAKERIEIRRAYREQNAPFAQLIASNRGVALQHYQARATKKKGVIATVIRGEKRRIPGGFRAGSLPGFWRRKGRARLPIVRLYGPSVANLITDILPNLELDLSETLKKRWREEIDFEISRAR